MQADQEECLYEFLDFTDIDDRERNQLTTTLYAHSDDLTAQKQQQQQPYPQQPQFNRHQPQQQQQPGGGGELLWTTTARRKPAANPPPPRHERPSYLSGTNRYLTGPVAIISPKCSRPQSRTESISSAWDEEEISFVSNVHSFGQNADASQSGYHHLQHSQQAHSLIEGGLIVGQQQTVQEESDCNGHWNNNNTNINNSIDTFIGTAELPYGKPTPVDWPAFMLSLCVYRTMLLWS